ncbi:serine/threonine-protein kinase, partial [Amaricoccus sp.]|uniref:serine/threonine-protein kinase n=1 Tax=Amaricoccus sp. TaxID=1872485 RepID=UPI0026025B51
MIDPLPGDIFRKGQVLNNTYEIEGVLGRGGTGEVYRARNQITGRVVAVKALNREFSHNDAYLELMKREEEMRNIQHEAVVRYTDCSRTAEGHVYLVMDHVDGTPLADWMERSVQPRDLLVVAHRVAEGLVATHGRNIVHRDLSPDNIILRGDDPAEAVIIDFGIAKDSSAGARTIVGSDFAGKYEYAAPEQMHGRAEPRSDLYSLGASLLAVYRGRVPEVGRSPGEVLRRKEEPLDTSGVPEPLKGLIDTLTQPDPARRPPSAAAAVAEIGELLRPKAAAAARPRRRRWWLVAAPV